MFLSLVTLSISIGDVEGGWISVPVDSENVKAVKPYLDRNIPHLFPEFENGQYVIEDAKQQIVAGINLQLTIKSPSSTFAFVITLYVNLQKQIEIKEINKPFGAKPMPGAYMWQNPSHFTSSDLYHAVQLIQSKIDMLIQKSGNVLVYRTKVVNGLNTHIIFRDSMNTVCSAVFFKNTENNTEQFISAHQIN